MLFSTFIHFADFFLDSWMFELFTIKLTWFLYVTMAAKTGHIVRLRSKITFNFNQFIQSGICKIFGENVISKLEIVCLLNLPKKIHKQHNIEK